MTNTETVSTERLRELTWQNVMPTEFASIVTELLASRTQSPAEPTWRDLALQFDGHRIEVLSILRGILAHNTVKHDCGAREFLTKPPLPGEAVLAARIEALRAAPVPVPVTSEADGGFWRATRKFQLGDRVTKTKGSSWTGKVVGFYSTALTPVGYAVESENEPGSVQIYPEAALSVKPGEQG